MDIITNTFSKIGSWTEKKKKKQAGSRTAFVCCREMLPGIADDEEVVGESKFLLLLDELGHLFDVVICERNFFFFTATCTSKEKVSNRQNKRAVAHDGFRLPLLLWNSQVLSKNCFELALVLVCKLQAGSHISVPISGVSRWTEIVRAALALPFDSFTHQSASDASFDSNPERLASITSVSH